MKRFQYTVHVTKFLIFSAVVCLLGGIFTVNGLVRLYHRNHVKKISDLYNKETIHRGDYVQYSISPSQVLGRSYEELSNGEEKYSPICTENAWTSDRRYVVALGGGRDFYIALFMSDEQRRDFEQFIDSMTGTYQVFGRVERLGYHLPYDMITECTGIDDQDKLDQLISKKYEIRVIDPETRESMWYKALIVFALGLCGVLRGIEKRRKDT